MKTTKRSMRLRKPSYPVPGLVAAALVVAGSTLPDAVWSQEAPEVRIWASFSGLDPAGTFTEAPFLSSGNIVTYPDLGVQPAAGLAVSVSWPDGPWTVRVEGLRSFGDESVGTWGCPPAEACPSILIRIPTDVRVWVGTADVIVHPRHRLNPWGLYALAGLGWVSYDLSWDPDPVGNFSLAPGEASESELALHAGVGVNVELPWATLGAELTALLPGGRDEGEPRRLGLARVGLGIPLI